MTTPTKTTKRPRGGRADPHDPHFFTCALDGATLDPTGYCPTGHGYPAFVWFWATGGTNPPYPRWVKVMTECPIACPICTARLDWAGGCLRCNGSRTPDDLATWTFPGDRYDYDTSGHWMKTVTGPQAVLSDAEFSAVLQGVRQMMAMKPST